MARFYVKRLFPNLKKVLQLDQDILVLGKALG